MKESTDRFVRAILAGAAVVALALVAATVVMGALPRFRSRFLSPSPPAYEPGDQLTLLPANLRLEHRNVVVFSRHDCSACQQSKAEFTNLAADLRGARPVQLIFIVPAPLSEEELIFGREIGLESSPLGLSLQDSRLRGVPSVAVVDERGKILMFHEGVLTEETRRYITTVAAS
jgi:hypothetical protein